MLVEILASSYWPPKMKKARLRKSHRIAHLKSELQRTRFGVRSRVSEACGNSYEVTLLCRMMRKDPKY